MQTIPIEQKRLIDLFSQSLKFAQEILIDRTPDNLARLSNSLIKIISFFRKNHVTLIKKITYAQTYLQVEDLIVKISELDEPKLIEVIEIVRKLHEITFNLLNLLNMRKPKIYEREEELMNLGKLLSFELGDNMLSDIFEFLIAVIEFSRKTKVKLILVTEKSARILGIALLHLLKKQKIKNIIVTSFVPDPISRPNNPDAGFFELNQLFAKEKKSIYKKIKNNTILILDEYIFMGETLKKSKEFFKQLGAKKVYTASMYYEGLQKMFVPDVLFAKHGPPKWYDSPIMLKRESKINSFRPELIKFETKEIEKKAKELKQLIIQKLKTYVAKHT